MLTPDGRPITSRGWLHFGRDGLAVESQSKGRYLRLDVERTWLLVKAFMSDQEAHIQFLFVARWIEALVIEHALARGEDDELVYRASRVLRQPGDSFSHDDHFHVRIACTPQGTYRWLPLAAVPNQPWVNRKRPEHFKLIDKKLFTGLSEGDNKPPVEDKG